MIIVNELTRLALALTFRDETGAETTPTGVTYRITNAAGTVIKPDAPLTVTGPTATLEIPAADNVCTVAGSTHELRRVIVKAENLAQEVYEYRIERIA